MTPASKMKRSRPTQRRMTSSLRAAGARGEGRSTSSGLAAGLRVSVGLGLLVASWLASGCVDKSPPALWPSPPPPSVALAISRPAPAAPTAPEKTDAPATDTVWSERPPPLAAPPPPEPVPGDKPKLREKLKESLKETLEGARDRIDESREERAAKQRDKQQQRLEKRRRKPVP